MEQDPGGGQKGWDEDTRLSGTSEPKGEDASSSREQAACSGLGCFPQAGGEARAPSRGRGGGWGDAMWDTRASSISKFLGQETDYIKWPWFMVPPVGNGSGTFLIV